MPKNLQNITEKQSVERLASLPFFGSFETDILMRLAAGIEWLALAEGEVLFEQNDEADAMYVVYSGTLEAYVGGRAGRSVVLSRMDPGTPVGEIALLLGGRRNASVAARGPTELARLSAAEFGRIVAQLPQTREQLMAGVTRRLRNTQLMRILPYFFGEIDETVHALMESHLEWVHLKRNGLLFRKGDRGDSLYILVHGLLHAVADDNGGERVIGPVYRGEIVGEMAVLCEEERSASVYAVRDSDLVRLSKDSFQAISARYPQVTTAIAKILVDRLKNRSQAGVRKSAVNIALVAAGPSIPMEEFAEQLHDAFSGLDATVLINSAVLAEHFGRKYVAQATEGDPRYLGLRAWLEQQESANVFVLYQADGRVSTWSKRCIEQADQVLIAADADGDPEPGEIEKELLSGIPTAAGKSLVLFHRSVDELPSGTSRWLAERQLSSHHHVRWRSAGDFRRIARILSRRAIGVALGGGGAKGMAHIGVLRALDEAGVPVDMIGGTSMGAIVASQYAMGRDWRETIPLARKTFVEINPFNEFTLPLVSLIRGRKLDYIAKYACGHARIEDLWLSYFSVSCNLTQARLKVHRTGPVWKAIRTSGSLPGIVVPMVEDGDIYVDGGVMNNLPGDIMREQCGTVIAVQVTAASNPKVEFDRFPSPWRMLWRRLLPFRKPIPAPNILDIMMSTIDSSSRRGMNEVRADADLFLTPPVQDFGMLDFKNLEKIAQSGYEYTRDVIAGLTDRRLIAKLRGFKSTEDPK